MKDAETTGKVLNLTLTSPTLEQIAAGLVDASDKLIRGDIVKALTFKEPPRKNHIFNKASILGGLATEVGAETALIDGPPYLVPALERELELRRIKVVYAHWEYLIDVNGRKNGSKRFVCFVEAP